MTLAPFALPALLLALPLVLPLVPLLLAGGAVYVARRAWRARFARPERPNNELSAAAGGA